MVALGEMPDGSLALAVSGGPDSMAMLALAHAAFPGAVIAATVDHGLRAEAVDEAAMVANWCRAAGVAHTILTPDTPIAGASVQASARHARYALLAGWALDAGACSLLTAHHADDQAETFLMRAARGSGPGGLAGIRPRWTWERHRWNGNGPRGPSLPILRPLLSWRRRELRDIATACHLPFVDDPSNADSRFDRVRMRQMLAEHGWLDTAAIARSAQICAEVDADLNATIRWLQQSRTLESDANDRRIDVRDLPRELRRRLVRDAIGYVRDICAVAEGSWSESANVEALLEALESGRGATLAGVMASAKGNIWHFREAPPRRSH